MVSAWDGIRVPEDRTVYAEIEFDDYSGEETGSIEYRAYTLNPFKNQIFDILKVEEIPNNVVKCPYCGAFPNIKVTTPEGFKELNTKWMPKGVGK